MPETSLKVIPGVDQNETSALNEAAISSCNMIRFIPDRSGIGLVQKLGGWSAYYPYATNTITRALWAWEDTNSTTYLAAGNQASSVNYQASLIVLSNGSPKDISPRTLTTNPAVSISTTSGSAVVTVTDTGITASSYDIVYISTPIAVGGIVLSGFYQTTQLSSSTFTIISLDQYGNLSPATSTVTNGGSVAQFTTVSSSSVVTVSLTNHGLAVGNDYPVLISTLLNGILFSRVYVVSSVIDANTFTIQAQNTATISGSGFENGGNANFVYYVGLGQTTSGTGYGIGGYGTGGYGSGTSVVPSTGVPIYTNDWTLDNFGKILVACPVPALSLTFQNATATGSGSVATVSFAQSYKIPVGNVITVSGMSINGYNGTYTVTASSAGSVSYSTTTTGTATGGTVLTISPASGPIFQWDPTTSNPIATVMPAAPAVSDGIFVAMPQRQIVAWGSTFDGIPDPLLLRWCDIQNYGVWIAQSTNQAGSYRIPRGARIVGGIQGPQQALIWTDLAVWSMQYIGQPFVYAFNELGVGCGMIGRKCAGTLNGVVYWMGQNQFFQLNAEGVNVLQCPVWDVVYQQLDTQNVNKIRVAVNSMFGEVAWYYPTLTSGGEVSAYVKFNAILGQWDFGNLARSAWINQSVLGPPIGADPVSQYIYQHEISMDAANGTQPVPMVSFYQTGYFSIQNADMKGFIDQVWPDAKWGFYAGTQSATLNLSFYVTDFPGQNPVVYGPYSLTSITTYISPRIRGRLVSIKIQSQDSGSFWRIGNLRYRVQPDGKF
jgi:hypothetical protein